MADYHSPLTPAEKVAEAELIVHGVATLEGLPLEKTERPVERSCRIAVLQTLWPTNQPATNIIVVTHWAWTQWPDKWWNHNSRTGVYFFVRTTTALKEVRDDDLGTNMWIKLGHRVEDWYEPATNITSIQQLIKTKDNKR